MHCIDLAVCRHRLARCAALSCGLVLAACGSLPSTPAPTSTPAASQPVPLATGAAAAGAPGATGSGPGVRASAGAGTGAGNGGGNGGGNGAGSSAQDAQPGVGPLPSVAPAPVASVTPATVAARTRQPRFVQLPPPAMPRSIDELQRQFAKRLVDAHPDGSFTDTAPPRLLAIPVIEVEFNQDGSVRATRVIRHPSTGPEATTLALAAIRRAAPYGNVSRVPKPWKIVEAFLFDDQLRFKPRTLDLD